MAFNNKMVLITGASPGIGIEFARAFSKKGCKLILVARRADRLHALAAELGTPCEVLPADLSEEKEVLRIAELTKDQKVDIQEQEAEWKNRKNKRELFRNPSGWHRTRCDRCSGCFR